MTSALLVVLAAASAAAAPPRPANAAAWISMQDYPADAVDQHREGKVGFAADIDADGNVTGCRITQSSGTPSLDGTTCALLFRRAHFFPATDADGKATAGTYASRITWVYPSKVEGAPLSGPEPIKLSGMTRSGQGSSTLYVDERGVVERCDYFEMYANSLPTPDLCGFFPKASRFSPPALVNGKPIRRKITLHLMMDDDTMR